MKQPADTAARAKLLPVKLCRQASDDLAKWAASVGATQIATAYVTCGPQRDWDHLIWPHATAGFFTVRQQIPQIFGQLVTR